MSLTEFTAFDSLVTALRERGGRVIERGHGQVKAECPAHDDRAPSLSVTGIEGQVLIHCHAGCGTGAVLDALGKTKADLYDDPRGPTYIYPDGRQVHRTPEKTFSQSGNTKGKALFHADRIGDALTVYVVEGEKDVLATESVNGIAVCFAMGAGKAKYADWSPLAGKRVVIVADQDDPGRQHADQVAELVAPLAQSVSIVEPVEGKDAADHIAAGHSLDEFIPVTSRLLASMRDGAWLDGQNFPPLEYAVPHIIPEGCGLLVGPPKVGKSWLVGDIGLAVAAGGKALGCIPVNKRPVLYLALEDGHRRLQSRFRELLGDGQPIPPGINVMIKVTPAEAIPTISAFLTQHAAEKPLVILDTLGKVRPPKRAGEDSYQVDYAVGGALKAAVDSVAGASLVIVHHTRKAESSDFVDAVSGTQGVAGSADFVLVLKRQRQSDEGVLAVTGRDIREAEYALRAVRGVLWQLDGDDLIGAARAAQTRGEVARLADRTIEVLRLVNDRGENHTRAGDVAEGLGVDAKRAAETLGRLVDGGHIRKVSRGVYGPLHVPTAESAESAESAGQAVLVFPHLGDGSADSAEIETGNEQVFPPNPHFPHYPHCRACGQPVTTGVGDVHLGCRESST